MSGDFSPEQKRYLEGFTSGLQIARAGRGLAAASPRPQPPSGPDAEHIARAGPHRRGRRQAHRPGEVQARASIRSTPIARLKEQAAKNEPPKPADNFRWRYYGLFYVAPAQNSYMCRLRIPNGILTHWQFAGLADLAERYGGGYSHVTTRANLQIREIEPKNAVDVLEGDSGSRPVLARHRRRQHPQRHRHADRRHRSAGTARHAALRARVAPPHPQRARALRPAAQVQRRVRRRRHHPGAGGHQRHRLPGGRGEGRLRRRARRLVPARARRHHRPQGFRARHRRDREARRTRPRSPTPSCACSSSTATAPTATRRG